MKKILFIMVIALLGVTTASAQFTKGTKNVFARTTGLDLSFGNDKTDLNLGAGAGYFIIDRLELQADIFAQYQNYDKTDDDSFDFGFGVGANYFFYKILYGGVGLDFTKYEGSDFSVAINLEVGARYYLVNSLFVNPAVYYNSGFGSNQRSNFGLSVGLGVSF